MTELLLPTMDGGTLAAVLAAHPRTRAIPLIVVSVVQPDDRRARVLRDHCRSWLTKPVRPDDLRAAVARCLEPLLRHAVSPSCQARARLSLPRHGPVDEDT